MLRLLITSPAGPRAVDCDRDEVVLGRREGVDVALDDPTVARNHCVLRLAGRRVLLIDLGSSNGTLVRKERVSEILLQAGDEFRIGNTVVRIEDFIGAKPTLAGPPTPPALPSPRAPVAAGPSHDFGRELRTMLARTPWYMVSLIVHVIALLLLNLVPFSVHVQSLHRPLAAVNRNDVPDAETDLLEYKPPELERPSEVIDDISDEREEEGTPEPDKAIETRVQPLEEDKPDHIGIDKSLMQKIRPLSIQPQLKKPGELIDRNNVAEEHGRAKTVVARGMGRSMRTLRSISGDSIVIMRGDFDKMENILDLYRVPYTLVDRKRFARKSFPKAKVIFANCARKPVAARRNGLVARIKRFVNRGGWFLSSDWSVDPYLTQGWPGIVRVVPPTRRQSNTKVRVEQAAQSPLLSNVFGRRAHTLWWLEDTSTFFKVNESRATVLVRSPDMEERYGAGTVAFEFHSGRGRVLHLLGHFYQKEGNRAGLVAMHSIILNFLREHFVRG